MITKNGEGTDIDGEQRRQRLDFIHNPLLAVLVVAARMLVLPTQEGTAYTAIYAVVVGGIREADQVAAGLCHGMFRASSAFFRLLMGESVAEDGGGVYYMGVLLTARNEVKVMVRYPEEDRRSLKDLENMRIRTPAGGEIPLRQAANLEAGRGFSVINRTDQKRVINVSAGVDNKVANAEEIIDDLKGSVLAELTADYPGLTYDMEGEAKERKDSMQSMGKGFMLALIVMYALLAIPFKSYSQPLLIMTAIPFGVVGAVLGHLITGYDLSILSLFGIVALSGVVVNDSLLMIDRINQGRKDGEEMHESILSAGQRRFRPILLTSLTTFFGLGPMILETSTQAQFLIPMAISLAFGILFATGITLLLIPTVYYVLEDIRNLFSLKPVHKRH